VRSNGEMNVKVTRSTGRVAPGYTLTISDEYTFEGEMTFLQYDATMVKLRSVIVNPSVRSFPKISPSWFESENE